MADLVNLSLRNLNLGKNSDGLVLARLPKLSTLRINNCDLVDLTPLSQLPSLKNVNLSDNSIDSILPLKHLKKLVRLDLESNLLDDVSPLSKLLYLKEVNLSRNNLQNLGDLFSNCSLRSLSASYNPLMDTKVLSDFYQLTELRFSGVGLDALDCLEDLKNLTFLELRDNEIIDLSLIDAQEKLRYLDLSGNKIQNISALRKKVKLRHLYLRDNQITDIAPLANLKLLNDLNLANNSIEDLYGLKRLPALAELDLSHNRLTDIDPLRTLPRLRQVNLSNNTTLDEKQMFVFLNDLEKALKETMEKNHDFSLTDSWAYRRFFDFLYDEEISQFLSEIANPEDIPKIRSELFKSFMERFLAAQLVEHEFDEPIDDSSPFDLQDLDSEGEDPAEFDPESDADDNDSDDPRSSSGPDDFSSDDDVTDLLSKLQDINSDDQPDDMELYHSLDDIEGLPPEIMNFLRNLSGGPSSLKVRILRRANSDFTPGLPHGTIVIRCLMDSDQDPNSNKDDHYKDGHREKPFYSTDANKSSILNRRRGGIFGFDNGESDIFPVFRVCDNSAKPADFKDDDAFKLIKKKFFLLNFNPAKFSLH
jgi:Leucine-rich repeat (LRR) protein